jgi:biotin operon repressor
MQKPYVVSNARQLQVIASPGREAIIDAVGLIGPCSVPQLARELGFTRHALYYHIKALRNVGLLVEEHRSQQGKRATAYYDLPGRPLSVSFDLSTRQRREAVVQLARTRLKAGERGFNRAVKDETVIVKGPRRELWATHLKGWLSRGDLKEANGLLRRLIALVGSKTASAASRERAFEFTFVLCPHAAGRIRRK